jgi:hypothetical protein
MKTYLIKQDDENGDFNIHYFINNELENIEYYSKSDGTEVAGIKEEYTLKTDL